MSNNKRVLVTGASGGIGQAIATELTQAGYHVVMHYRRGEDTVNGLISKLQEQGFVADKIQFDISNRTETREALEQECENSGAFYGVVCNAGLTRDAAFPALSDNDWDDVLRTNLDGFYNVLHPLVMPMIGLRQGGRIISISSVSGVAGNRGQVNYSASKAGLIGASKALAVELAKRKITVNCVAPGLIDTAMVEETAMQEALKMIPMRRAGKVEEVAGAVSFLMSEKASYITRQVISVNGGMC